MNKKVLGELETTLGMQTDSLLALEQMDADALQTLAEQAGRMLEQERQALESDLVDALPRIPGPLAPIARSIFK